MGKAKFVLRKGRNGKYRFNLVGTSGKIIVTSEPYAAKPSALKAIDAVKKSAAAAEVVDETRGKSDEAKTSKRVAPKAAGITKSARLARNARGVAASPDLGPVGVEIAGAHLPGRS
jgi:uncharacterized protein YegP (UPF0339 family)